MFVKFACGCIGLKTEKPATYTGGGEWTKALVFYICDSEDEGFAFYYRDVREPATPMTDAETDAFVERFGRHFGRAVASLNAMQSLQGTLVFLARNDETNHLGR